MRARFRWSNGEIEEFDVPPGRENEYEAICSRQGIDPHHCPTVSLSVLDCFPQIPVGTDVPAQMQAAWESVWKPPTKRDEFMYVLDNWVSWLRVVRALEVLDLSSGEWQRALKAAGEASPPAFGFAMGKASAMGGPAKRSASTREDIKNRISPQWDAGVRDRRSLAKAYRESFYGQTTKPVTTKTLFKHLDAILDDDLQSQSR